MWTVLKKLNASVQFPNSSISTEKQKIEEMDVGLNSLVLAKIHNQGSHLYRNM